MKGMERAHWTPNMKRPSPGYASDDGLNVGLYTITNPSLTI